MRDFISFSRASGSSPASVSGVLLALSVSRLDPQVARRRLPVLHLAELDVICDEFRRRFQRQVARRRLPVLHFAEIDVFGDEFGMHLELQVGLVGPIGQPP